MNPVDMLKSDHEKVKGMFRQYEQATSSEEKHRIAMQACNELQVHSKLEEEIFYPAVRSSGGSEEQDLVAEGLEEHHAVDRLIMELQAMGPNDAGFETKFRQLMTDVEHHIQEEETEMLPDAERTLGGQLDRLGDQMQQRKQELMATMR